MDYSLLLIIVKNDAEVINNTNTIKKHLNNPYCFYTKNKTFMVTMGVIDYL
jgi:hypothetical protein